MLYLGPVLLSKQFQRRVYFDHFIELVKLIRICIQFKISTVEISILREGFQNWVLKYEQKILLMGFQVQSHHVSQVVLSVFS